MYEQTHRRSHLTKEQRLPQSFKEVEKILKKVKKCEASVKTALNSSKLRGAVLHKVSGLTFSVLKQSRILDSIIKSTQILEKEPFLRKELAGILIHELIFGNGLPGKSKPVETVLKYQADIEKTYNNLKLDNNLINNLISIPKYVRVNTLVTTLPEVLEDLEYLGVKQNVFDANISEEEFYNLVKNLEKNTFLVDFHFKDLLIFHGEENLTSWSLYKKGHVFIQDKSSYIPAYVLDPPPGVTVIDACAAPGMKTLHLTALMENNGIIYAFERDQQRFEILNSMLKSGHANICQTFCGDFNSVDPKDEKYASVEYILLDPSCSGSGMVSRMDCITDTKESKNDLRIQKLAGFQIILLKHALLFPSVKRVVYSTCSITEAENEFVVHEVLNHFSHRFKLVPVLPNWSIRGSSDFEFGSHCLRAYPDKCLTNGFFVAMFERLEDSEEHYRSEKKQHESKKKKFNTNSHLFQKESEFSSEKENLDNNLKLREQFVSNERKDDDKLNFIHNKTTEEMPQKKKHKKHKKDKLSNMEEDSTDMQATVTMNIGDQNENSNRNVEETKPLKKKHKSKENNSLIGTQILNSESQDGNIEFDMQEIDLKHKKYKRKHKKGKGNDSSTNNNLNDKQSQKVQTQLFVETNFVSEVKTHKKCEESNDNSFSNSQNSNNKDDTLTERFFDVKTPYKRKKHKRKHERDDCFNNFNETQTTELQPDQSSEDSILTKAVQVETEHKTKKKHKQKHEKGNNNSLCETETPKVQLNFSGVTELISKNTEQDEETLYKTKKKHKRKYQKEDCDNSSSGKEILEVQSHNIEDNLLAVQAVAPRKTKKKHKQKHEKEDCNISFSKKETTEIQAHNSNFEDNVLTMQEVVESCKIKKKHKRKHDKEDSNIFCETEYTAIQTHNSSVEDNISTGTVPEVKAPHKKKKKQKETKN